MSSTTGRRHGLNVNRQSLRLVRKKSEVEVTRGDGNVVITDEVAERRQGGVLGSGGIWVEHGDNIAAGLARNLASASNRKEGLKTGHYRENQLQENIATRCIRTGNIQRLAWLDNDGGSIRLRVDDRQQHGGLESDTQRLRNLANKIRTCFGRIQSLQSLLQLG